MTARDLIDILSDLDPDEEVFVSSSPTSAYRLLGVFSRNGRVYLDPSVSDNDKVAGFQEVW